LSKWYTNRHMLPRIHSMLAPFCCCRLLLVPPIHPCRCMHEGKWSLACFRREARQKLQNQSTVASQWRLWEIHHRANNDLRQPTIDKRLQQNQRHHHNSKPRRCFWALKALQIDQVCSNCMAQQRAEYIKIEMCHFFCHHSTPSKLLWSLKSIPSSPQCLNCAETNVR